MINKMRDVYRSYINEHITVNQDKDFTLCSAMEAFKNMMAPFGKEERSIVSGVMLDLYKVITSDKEDASDLLEFITGYLAKDKRAILVVQKYLKDCNT